MKTSLRRSVATLGLSAALAMGGGAALAGQSDATQSPAATPSITKPGTMREVATPGVDHATRDEHPRSSDWSITKNVREQLKSINGVQGNDVRVHTDQGVVTLSGKVSSESELRQIKEKLKGIHGVKQVDTSGVKLKK